MRWNPTETNVKPLPELWPVFYVALSKTVSSAVSRASWKIPKWNTTTAQHQWRSNWGKIIIWHFLSVESSSLISVPFRQCCLSGFWHSQWTDLFFRQGIYTHHTLPLKYEYLYCSENDYIVDWVWKWNIIDYSNLAQFFHLKTNSQAINTVIFLYLIFIIKETKQLTLKMLVTNGILYRGKRF